MALLWKTRPGIGTPIVTSFLLFPTLLRGMWRWQGVSIVISSMGYHVPKPVMEPMLHWLAACGARRRSGGPSWLRFCMNHKPVLKEHVDLLFKGILVPITLFIAARIFHKTMFPWHLRTNTTDVSCVFRIIESYIKLVILPIGLKHTQFLFCSNM
jgi:hypothetical protein